MTRWQLLYFYGLNFLLGFVSLAVEILFARAVAPFWGAGTIVWSFVVGLVLIVLALGYWQGGKLADKYPDSKHLVFFLIPSALFLLPLSFILPDSGATLLLFSLIASLSLFFLGAGAPWVLRVLTRDVSHTGELAGRLFAFSTIGSFLGSILTALILLPFIGTKMSFIFLSALLFFYLAVKAPRILPLGILFLPAVLLIPTSNDAIFEKESPDQLVRVFKDRDGSKRLVLNNEENSQSFVPAKGYLTGRYWDAPLYLWPAAGASQLKSVLILGNGAGTTARAVRHFYPKARIDTVESDPVVIEASRKFFSFKEDENLKLYKKDARRFVRENDQKYSVIFSDIYDSSFIPFQFATKEFFRDLSYDLKDKGILILNLNSKDPRIIEKIQASGEAAFRSSGVFQIKDNLIFIFSNQPFQEKLKSPLDSKETIKIKALERSEASPWTDDKSNIELLFPF